MAHDVKTIHVKKIDPKVAKGALIGASAAFAGSDKGYKAEEAFRDALRAAKKSGCSQADCEKIVGSAVVNTIDRYGDDSPMAESPRAPYVSPLRGLEKTISKMSSARFGTGKFFTAGFVQAATERGSK